MTSPRLDGSFGLSGRQVELLAGDLQATVVEVGGGVRVLTHGGVRLLDGYELDEMVAFAQGQALAPWPNRLADGR